MVKYIGNRKRVGKHLDESENLSPRKVRSEEVRTSESERREWAGLGESKSSAK